MTTVRFYVLRGFSVLVLVSLLVQVVMLMQALADPRPGGTGQAVVVAVFAWLAWYLWRAAGASPDGASASSTRAEAMALETAQFFERVNAAGAFFAQAPDRIMDRADRPLLLVSDAVMWEIRSRTSTTHVGTRVKLGGFPVLLGRSMPTTEEEAREACRGELALTPAEMLFVGDSRSADIRLDRIMSVELLSDGISVSVTGRQRPLMFKLANPILWAQVLKNVLALGVTGRALPNGARLEPR